MKDELQKYIKTLHISKDCNYLIFIGQGSGLTGKDLRTLQNERADVIFIMLHGNPNELVKTVEIPK